MSKPVEIKLSKRSIKVIEKLLDFASSGWYTDEVFDNDLFKSPEEEERHIQLILRKFEKAKLNQS